ncbi:MAG: SpoIIE family protein phosphatase, partial [Leptospiraceae bacterium]|nr:SpoIIE family protein phosphatase [Leptospiraceae bacterium]
GYFLNVRLKIAAMDDRMAVLGRQITMAVLWGILFHLVFGIFVYRVIFRRLHLLEEASAKMQTGDLSARAIWNASRSDELDDLGNSFNQMAGSIEDKVNTIQNQLSTISRLNDEMQNELDIGKDVQQAFFPDFSAFQEFKPSFVFMPLREVSGDMCNLYRFKDGDVGAFIGDAAGHGVSGALITALVTSSMDGAIGRHKEPRELLESMNGELCRRLTSTFYATGIYVLIQKGRLLYSGAGHVDCLVYHRRKDEFSRLESQGTPIGLFEDMRYPQLEIPYEAGDRLVLLTDGLTEATAGDQEFGMERARELIRSTASMHSDALSRALENSIRSFRTSETDDLTLLVMDLP